MDRWLAKTYHQKGAVISLEAMWRLAVAWYSDPRDAVWRPRTRDESQAVIRSAGLTGDFWELR